MAFFILEYGKDTDSLPAKLPFFIIIIIFEIESIKFIFIVSPSNYQLDLRTPGSIPSLASSRKQIRHKPKSLIKALPLPQRKHRFFCRVENFGFFKALAFTDVFAIINNIGKAL